MILTGLELSNFRNYKHLEIEFSEGRNIITGRNAQGKSNLLEAVYFLSHLRSGRAPRLRELVMEGETRAAARGTVLDGEDRLRINAVFGPQGRTVEVNARRVKGASKARGVLKCVLFEPDDLYLVKGEPARRRGYFDETMEELGPVPAGAVQQYRHVLRQRNALLRRWEDQRDLEGAIAPWNEALVSIGAEVTLERVRMVEGIEDQLSSTYARISGEDKELRVGYRGTFQVFRESIEDTAESMREALDRSGAEERRSRTTVVGPHREDVEIVLGGRGARFAASQGEQRTIAFCMRFAQRDYLREKTGKSPVLLLDDVLSELDEHRRRSVVELVGVESQAIITATELPESMKRAGEAEFLVEEGTVRVG